MRKDIDLNFIPHPLTGDLTFKTGKSAVEQSMKNLILTNYYERGFNVEAGSNLTDNLFDNFTPLIAQTMKDNIIQVLKNFEPNVEVVDVIVEQEESNTVSVEIYYNIFNDPQVRSVVIPIRRLR